MLIFFLFMMLIFLSLIMLFLNHPLSMGLMILIQTLLISILSGMMTMTYWFSYILFLTFLGGLLVLFIYISSIASNEMFKMSTYMKIFMIIYLFIFFMMLMIIQFNKLNWMNLNMNSDMYNFYNLMFFNNENKINLTKLYNSQTYLMMMMLIIYLFITLISVVKIINIFYGPLRSSSN
uniref:NADH-ubiquinone oxidoreductase chain 6 n=1 Tax=Pyrinioides aurea TaxID=393455 RepID=A0A0U2RZN9_9NEOP|nr:NADH dehydrogenase subunit 6 [Pyrinioides aurea]ALN96960.1 NADH dehydrogenase subunit 6 [Pyrinioides aurea]